MIIYQQPGNVEFFHDVLNLKRQETCQKQRQFFLSDSDNLTVLYVLAHVDATFIVITLTCFLPTVFHVFNSFYRLLTLCHGYCKLKKGFLLNMTPIIPNHNQKTTKNTNMLLKCVFIALLHLSIQFVHMTVLQKTILKKRHTTPWIMFLYAIATATEKHPQSTNLLITYLAIYSYRS